MNKFITAVKFLLPVVALGSFAIPTAAIIGKVGGWQFFFNQDFNISEKINAAQRIIGWLALLLAAYQIMLGSFRTLLEKLYGPGKILKIHMFTGPLVLGFVILHPLLYVFYESGINKDSIAKGLEIFIYSFNPTEKESVINFGRLAFYGLLITAGAAILRRKLAWRNVWKILHFLNYGIFIFLILHIRVGADANIWPFNAIAVIAVIFVAAGFLYRIFEKIKIIRLKKTAKIDSRRIAI